MVWITSPLHPSLLPVAHLACLMSWLHFNHAATLGRHLRVLASPTSWGLHCSLGALPSMQWDEPQNLFPRIQPYPTNPSLSQLSEPWQKPHPCTSRVYKIRTIWMMPSSAASSKYSLISLTTLVLGSQGGPKEALLQAGVRLFLLKWICMSTGWMRGSLQVWHRGVNLVKG